MLNTLFGDVVNRVSASASALTGADAALKSGSTDVEQTSLRLRAILRVLLECGETASRPGCLLTLEHFAPFFDLFADDEPAKVGAARSILSSFAHSIGCEAPQSDDFELAGHVLGYARVVNDALTALAAVDEARSLSEIIDRIIDRFEFGADFERQLGFYADCRGRARISMRLSSGSCGA